MVTNAFITGTFKFTFSEVSVVVNQNWTVN